MRLKTPEDRQSSCTGNPLLPTLRVSDKSKGVRFGRSARSVCASIVKGKSGASCVILAILTMGATVGCQSKAEKKRAEMRQRMGQIPEKYKNDGAPKVGEQAQLFKLRTLEGDREVDLASFAGDRPVVLFFGSYT